MTKRERLEYFKTALKKIERKTGLVLKIVIGEPRPRKKDDSPK